MDLDQLRSVAELTPADEIGKRNTAKAIRSINECPLAATSSNYYNLTSLKVTGKLSVTESLAYYMDSKCTKHIHFMLHMLRKHVCYPPKRKSIALSNK